MESFEEWRARQKAELGEEGFRAKVDAFWDRKRSKTSSVPRIVEAEKITSAIVEEIEDVIIEVTGECDEILRKIGKETVAELKLSSPQKTGKYAKSWKYKVSKNKLHNSELIVYNTEHRLTYWLERGHNNRAGTSRTRAIPHISIAQKHAVQKAEELMEGL